MTTKNGMRRKTNGTTELRLLCASLLAERRQIQNELQKLREENSHLRKSVGALMCVYIPINKRRMLAESATQPPIDELIAEIENARD